MLAVTLDLSEAATFNDAAVSCNGPVRVTTIPEQWSYAAGIRFEKTKVPGAERICVQVKLSVLSGRAGLVFVKDDLREILGNDEERSPADGETTANILVDEVPESGWIVVRNNTPGGVASECVIQSVAIHELPASPLRGFSEWAPKDETGKRLFAALREKWSEVPVGVAGRRATADLLQLDDARLRTMWLDTHREATTGSGFPARGWYQHLYSDVLRGKRVLDVGSGLGIDGLTFARAGASMTFLDIVPSNIELLQRLCGVFELSDVSFFVLEDLDSLDSLAADFDVIWCQGSMLHVPFEFSQREAQKLLSHLRPGGRWIELAYPRERWERDGSPPFHKWGKLTDGAATPWAEWYDLARLLTRLHPAEFEVILSSNFHNDDFVWFDLRKSG